MTTPRNPPPAWDGPNPAAALLADRAAALGADAWARTDPAGAWRVVVTPPAGKAARAAVAVYLPADALAPAVLDARDLVQTAARAALESAARGAGLPDASRTGFGDAVRALGAQLAERPRGAAPDAAGARPGAGSPITFDDPDPWPDAVDGAALLEDVAAFVAARVALPAGAADVCALWLAATYCPDVWAVASYLLVLSAARGCGKTTLLDVLHALARRAFSAADASPAALFRLIEKAHPTLFLDEIDAWLTAKREDGLVNLLNAGARQGGKAMRCAGEGAALDVAGFDVFGPKLLAGIAPQLPDATRSRCLALRLERADAAELDRLVPFSTRHRPQAAPLAARLGRWTADARDGAPGATATGAPLAEWPPMPPGLAGRDGEPWVPLFAVADAAGGRWPAAARAAVGLLAGGGVGEVRDLDELLLAHVGDYLARYPGADGPADAGGVVRLEPLREWLRADDWRPWATTPGRDGLTVHKLGRVLRDRWRVPTGQRRAERGADAEKVRGCDRAALAAVVARYVAPPLGEAGQAGPSGSSRASGTVAPASAASEGDAGAPVVPLVPARPACPTSPNRYGDDGRGRARPGETRAAAVLRVLAGRPGLLLAELADALGWSLDRARATVAALRLRVAERADGRLFLTGAHDAAA
ncbi:hypothetical protein tb265_26170 [Gemmatimonadetes bacterium T265]|nr:hypothetical protein tb265_26170 [Gemmatimonadetes bacterium T265]